MKKRVLAFVMSLTMALSVFSSNFAFADEAVINEATSEADSSKVFSNYSFEATKIISENTDSFKGIVVDEAEDGNLRVVFPAMDKKGNIIVSDPNKTLKGYNLLKDGSKEYVEFGLGGGGEISPYGNMEKGLIVNFSGYSSNGVTSNPSEEKDSNIKGDCELLAGISVGDNIESKKLMVGDLDFSGYISTADATAVVKEVLASNEDKIFTNDKALFKVADVNADNKISTADATDIVKKVLYNDYVFPAGEYVGGSDSGDESLKAYHVNNDGNKMIIDTNVYSSNGYATAYKIELSDDGGQTWKTDSWETRNTHGKKVKRLAYLKSGITLDNKNRKSGDAFEKDADGNIKYVKPDETYTYISEGEVKESGMASYIEDKKNTFYFLDQRGQNINATLSPKTEYIVRVSGYNYNDMNKANAVPFGSYETKFTTSEGSTTLAFPTVEGGGSYSVGGRGTATKQGDVYVVTNLSDSVDNPQPGSFRYGIKRMDRADKDSTYPRTIVFAVGGTIQIDETASKNNRAWDIGTNTTIMGQTAPGEGITFAGGSLKISGENIIVRYIRGRLGSGYDRDGGTLSGKNVVVDHCTFSWGVDETFSPKEMINSSIQYSIITNGLAVVNKNGVNNNDAELLSGEGEAKHGMATITNGYETSLTHNLYANCGTRMPRFEGGFTYNYNKYTNKMEFSNNVIYNWGHNSGYGGDRGEAQVNYTNNYYKPGINTLEKVKTQLFDCDTDSDYGNVKSSYYISGNYITSSAEVTADNTKGFRDLDSCANQLKAPVELAVKYEAEKAEDAYNHVLNSVGASFRRDAIDARLVDDVKDGTGSFINDQAEAGGFSDRTWTSSEVDTDNDGIPDSFEAKFGCDPKVADSTVIITDTTSKYCGYTPLEAYCYDLLGEWDAKYGYELKSDVTNPDIEIVSIIDNDTKENVLNTACTNLFVDKTYTIKYNTADGSKTLMLNDEVVASDSAISVSYTPSEVQTGSKYLAVKVLNGDKEGISLGIPVSIIDARGGADFFNVKKQVKSSDMSKEAGLFVDYDGFSVDKITTEGAAVVGSVYMQGSGRIGNTNALGTQYGDEFYFNGTKVSGDYSLTAKIDNWAKIDYMQKAGIMIRKDIDNDKSEFYMNAFTMLKGEDMAKFKDVLGNAICARDLVSFARKADGDEVTPSKEASNIGSNGGILGIPHNRINEEDNYGWMKIEKIGNTITTYGSLDGKNWSKLQEYTCSFGDSEYYIGFAIEGAQDTSEKTNINKAQFTNVKLEKLS